MIDLHLFQIHWQLLLGIFLGANFGIIIFSLLINKKSDLKKKLEKSRERIDEQVKIIFEMRKELVEAKGAASSEEFRADALQKMKDGLQEQYDSLEKDYNDIVKDYRKLYIELDALKASDARKFRNPEEIIKQMISDHNNNVLLANEESESDICANCEGVGEVIAEERIHSKIIDVPYKTCTECHGAGIR